MSNGDVLVEVLLAVLLLVFGGAEVLFLVERFLAMVGLVIVGQFLISAGFCRLFNWLTDGYVKEFGVVLRKWVSIPMAFRAAWLLQ